MIACPVCGAKTDVIETRSSGATVRRRRWCSRVGTCPGKVTTVESVVDEARPHRGPVVQVPKRQIDQLRKIVAELGGDRDRGA